GLILVASLKKAWSMTFIAVRCPPGQRNQSVQRGNTARGTLRSLCQIFSLGQGTLSSRLWHPWGRACGHTHAPRPASPGPGRARSGALPASLPPPRAACTHEARRRAGGGAPPGGAHPASCRGGLGPGARWGSGGGEGGEGGVGRAYRFFALALACPRSPHRPGLGLWLWAPPRPRVLAAHSAAGALRAAPLV